MTIRDEVFARDQHRCRIPWCLASGGGPSGPLEWSHLKARGMGGKRNRLLDTTANTIVACRRCHTGTRSLHSGHLKWRFLTDRDANGPMAFEWCEKLPKAEANLKLEEADTHADSR